MKDLLTSAIESAGESARALTDLGSTSPYIGSAIGALRAAQDNLNWELEAQARQLAAKTAAARKRSRTNWNGLGRAPKRGRPNPRRVSKALISWSRLRKTARRARHRSSFRCPNVWAAK